jgi:hypothetical protein
MFRWEANIGMDLTEIGVNTSNWIDCAQGRGYWKTLVNAALNLGYLKAWNWLINIS